MPFRYPQHKLLKNEKKSNFLSSTVTELPLFLETWGIRKSQGIQFYMGKSGKW